MPSSNPYRFLFRGLLWCAPLWVSALSVGALLWQVGEGVPISVVQKHMSDDSRFMRQYFDQGLYRFKWLSVAKTHPDIIALGTSRVMQFRDVMFGARQGTFFNAGGMVQHIGDLKAYVDAAASKPAPDVVILGVEFIWLNADYLSGVGVLPTFQEGVRKDDALDGFAHAQFYQRLVKGLVYGHGEYPQGPRLVSAWRQRSPSGAARFGVLARLHDSGFRRDGSYDYGLAWPQTPEFIDRETPTVAQRLKEGVRGFETTPSLSKPHVSELLECVRALHGRGTRVLCFSPPYPAETIDALRVHPGLMQAWAQYCDVLPRQLRGAGAVFVDASTPARLGLTDVYMRDGLHAMETFHVRLLQRFLEQDPGLDLGISHTALNQMMRSPESNPWFPDYSTREGA